MREKREAKVLIPLSLKEKWFVLFGKKTCPDCYHILKPVIEVIGGDLQGRYVKRGKSHMYVDRTMRYKRAYRCIPCRQTFFIDQLILIQSYR